MHVDYLTLWYVSDLHWCTFGWSHHFYHCMFFECFQQTLNSCYCLGPQCNYPIGNLAIRWSQNASTSGRLTNVCFLGVQTKMSFINNVHVMIGLALQQKVHHSWFQISLTAGFGSLLEWKSLVTLVVNHCQFWTVSDIVHHHRTNVQSVVLYHHCSIGIRSMVMWRHQC
jgi:hypothetical protein